MYKYFGGFEELCYHKGGMGGATPFDFGCSIPPTPRFIGMGPFNSAISNKETDGPGGIVWHVIPSLIPGVWNTKNIQRDSKRWTQIRTSIFPELYMGYE